VARRVYGPSGHSGGCREEIRAELDGIGDQIITELNARGLPPYASSLVQPWSFYATADPTQVLVTFLAIAGGMADILLQLQPVTGDPAARLAKNDWVKIATSGGHK